MQRVAGLAAVALLAIGLVVQSSAVAASSPEIFGDGVDNVGASTTNARANVDPNLATTTVRFDYAGAASPFCTNADGTGSGASSSPDQVVDASNPTSAVHAALTGLTPGAPYCFSALATSTNGATRSGFSTFVAGAPIASTDDAQVTGAATALVTGRAGAAGQPGATVYVDYGPASSQWCVDDGIAEPAPSHTTPQALMPVDADDHPVALAITGLSPGQDYCAEIVAKTGAASSALGGTVTFSAGAPSADTTDVAVSSPTAVNVLGVVNPGGQATTYEAEWDTSGSLFCQDPDNNVPSHATAPVALAFSDAQDHPVTVGIGGFTSGSDYCARIKAQTASGSAVGDAPDFTAGAAVVAANSITVTGATTAQLAGTVNPGGSATTYDAEYDSVGSDWCNGVTSTPGHTSPSQPLGSTQATAQPVTVALTGLTAGASYCVELAATNPAATVESDPLTVLAGLPVAATTRAFSTGAQSAELDGSVNPSSQATTYSAVYDDATSPWCTSGTGSAAHTTAPSSLAQIDAGPHDVAVALSGLTTGTHYCAALAASNGGGTVTGSRVLLTAGAPVVRGGDKSPVSASSVHLTATMDAAGQAGATSSAEYALLDGQFCQSAGSAGSPSITAPQPFAFSDALEHAIGTDLAGLTPGDGYCWRLRGTNASGTGHDTLRILTAGLPAAATDQPTDVSTTGATLQAHVDSENLSTVVQFEYGPASGDWCTSGGSAGVPPAITIEHPLGVTDAIAHGVSEPVAGLGAQTAYCYRVVAVNDAGTTLGSLVSFTSAGFNPSITPPSVHTGAATEITQDGATLRGSVNPNGAATSYRFEYGATTAYGNSTPTADAGGGSAELALGAAVGGLAPSTTYHFRIVAQNGGGQSDGADVTFTTLSPRGGGGLPGPPGMLTAARVQTSKRMDTVRGTVVVGADGSSLNAELLYSGKLARLTTIGKTGRSKLRRGVVPFVVHVNRRANRAFKRRNRVTVTLKTVLTPPTGQPVPARRQVTLERSKRHRHRAHAA